MRMITATVLMAIDHSLKNLVETLADVGQIRNSVILVNSDNGGDVVYSKGHPGNNYPLRSEKFSYFEGGVRVPAFVFAPGHIPPKRTGTSYHGLMHHSDLLATFYGLGGGDVSSLEGLDSVDHWDAIMGEATSPRNEIVLNLPRSKEWKVGESKTSEGVALIIGNYKLLYNLAYDSWFSPAPGVDFVDNQTVMAMECEYSFYTVSTNSDCDYLNYLFDLSEDPNERVNLWDYPEYDAIKNHMLARAEELAQTQPTDYGKIIPEFYEKGSSKSYRHYMKGNYDFVVPWQCDTIE